MQHHSFSYCLPVVVAMSLLSACATPEKAWEAYQTAEKYYQQDNYREAEAWYQKAIAEIPEDGILSLNETHRYRLGGGATSLRAQAYEYSEKMEYLPNQRLAKMAELRRTMLSEAERELKKLSPPQLTLHYSVVDEDGDGKIQVGEPSRLMVEIINQGGAAAQQVVLYVDNDVPGQARKSETFSTIEAGASATYEQAFTLSEDFADRKLGWLIRADEIDGYSPAALNVAMPVEPLHAPQLALRQIGHAGLVIGQSSELEFELSNVGQWSARNLQLTMQLEPKEHLTLLSQSWPQTMALLRAGEKVTLRARLKPSVLYPAHEPIATRFTWQQGEAESVALAQLSVPVSEMNTQYIAGAVPAVITDGLPELTVPALTTSGQPQPHSYAFVIGNAHYKNLPNLPVPYAVNDARAMSEVFEKSIGVPKENIRRYENATSGELQTLLGVAGGSGVMHELVGKHSRIDTLYFYYSGHGIPAKNRNWSAYLMPTDGAVDYIDQSGYAISTLYTQLAKIPARQIVVMLDACFSGQTQNGIVFTHTSPGTLVRPSIPKSDDQRITVLTAAAGNDLGIWSDSARHGLFTTYLIKGLSGEADDGNRELHMEELYHYVHDGVSQAAARMNRSQNPVWMSKINPVITRFSPHQAHQ